MGGWIFSRIDDGCIDDSVGKDLMRRLVGKVGENLNDGWILMCFDLRGLNDGNGSLVDFGKSEK